MRDDASGSRAGWGQEFACPPALLSMASRERWRAVLPGPRWPPLFAASIRPDMRAALWATLAPLMLLLHPYAGLVQDARIYVGRGVADSDPAGVGRDVMFLHDGQTGFSLMQELVDASMSLMGPASTSMALAFLGSMAGLAAAVAVARGLARGRAAWAVAVCMIALPTGYGAFGIFNYAETIATPRLFAQAAVLGGLAAWTAGRRGAGAALLALAFVIHPLVALPGAVVGAALLVQRDRRWLGAAVAVGVAVVGAALVGVPLASRLLQPMDGAWQSILRGRSTYLFPTLWPAGAYGPILCQATAVTAAAALSRTAVRELLLAVLAAAAAGLAVAWSFGDVWADTLIVQVQPWRALWLLAAFGNAALALSVIGLWRRGPTFRPLVAPLLLAWLWSDNLPAVAALSALTLAWLAAALRGRAPSASRAVIIALAGVVGAAALLDVAATAWVGLKLIRSAGADGGEVVWPMIVALRIQTVPVAAAALSIALAPLGRPRAGVWARVRAGARAGAVLALGVGCVLAALLWDGRTAEQGFMDAWSGDPGLTEAVGPGSGEVMWIDEDREVWFLLHRPSFLNTAQAGPMLFSRALAMEWAERAATARSLGWARPSDVSPWTAPDRRLDPVVLRPDTVARFCADRRRPAAVVAPGDQRGAAPAGWTARLWRPTSPFRRVWLDAGTIRWTTWDGFTVIRCPGADGPAGRAARPGDARSLG